MRRLLAVGVVVLALPGVARATTTTEQVVAAKAGLQKSVATGQLTAADAALYRSVLARTAAALPRLGGSRYANLSGVLGDVARLSGSYTAPRALTLFSMLDWNTHWFGAQGPPVPQADTTAPDGVVYRYFPGHGLQFHPLGNMASLNSLLALGRLDQARLLADALRARAARDGAAALWEYEWPFAGGRPPWTSGMAQSVAAQALARASQKLGDPSLGELARQAYAAIPGRLVMSVAEGTWIKLYSFTRTPVFNAQLQSAVSLRDYADLSGDSAAGALSDQLRQAAQKAVPRVDTGYWTRYSLGGEESPAGYHDFVISILGRLEAQTKDSFWSDLATRFKAYTTQATELTTTAPAPPAPAGTGKAALTFSLWVSKLSSVTLSAAGQQRRLTLTNGWHRLTWTVPRGSPGVFPVAADASPVEGPRMTVPLPPLVVLAPVPPGLGDLVAASAPAGPVTPAGPGLLVGAAEDATLGADAGTTAQQLATFTASGLRALRITAQWSPGQTVPDPALLARYATTAQQAAALGIRVYLELYPASAAVVPLDDARRAEFVAYARAFVTALPQVRDVIVGSQVNNPAFWPQTSTTPTAYLALLAAAYDGLKAVDPTTRVIGGALNAQLAPMTFVLSLGQAYRKSGRATPVMDALALQPAPATSAEPPTTVHPTGPTTIADYPRLVANLKRAFDTTAQPGATLPIVYDGYGVQTAIPPEKAALYGGAETDAVTEDVQAVSYAQAIALAACQPTVSAFLFEHVVDEHDLGGRQTGLYYPDLSPKRSFSAVRTAIAGALAGTLAPCPGSSPKPAAPPSAVTAPDGRSVRIACPRDCTYVVALERGGVPVRARAGVLTAATGLSVTAPAIGLATGDRLVARVASKLAPSDEVVAEGGPITTP